VKGKSEGKITVPKRDREIDGRLRINLDNLSRFPNVGGRKVAIDCRLPFVTVGGSISGGFVTHSDTPECCDGDFMPMKSRFLVLLIRYGPAVPSGSKPSFDSF
jgi:hypothetical protein